jgi:hypothetical protein
MTDSVYAWCLVNGAWVEREDPVMAVCDPYGGDVRAAMAHLGYEAWCQIGELPSVPVSLALYSREAPPLQFLLQLEGNAGNVVEHIFAETLPDAMELLARWTPIARAGTHPAPYDIRRDGRGRAGSPGRAEDDSAPAGRERDRAGNGSGRGRDGDRPDPSDRHRTVAARPDPTGSPSAVDRVGSSGG